MVAERTKTPAPIFNNKKWNPPTGPLKDEIHNTEDGNEPRCQYQRTDKVEILDGCSILYAEQLREDKDDHHFQHQAACHDDRKLQPLEKSFPRGSNWKMMGQRNPLVRQMKNDQ